MNEEKKSESHVDAKVNNSLIFLSNFNQKPHVSFENVKRELMIIPPTLDDYNKRNGIDLSFPVDMEVQKYHRMRFLLLKTNKYCFEHDTRDKQGKMILNEIGSLQGRQGEFNLFGLIYKDSGR